MTGFIYAIESGGRVKIGFSKDPMKRLNKINSDTPFPCTMLGFWPGSVTDERAAHAEFESVRLHGEWFESSDELMAFVRNRAIEPVPPTKKMVDFVGFMVPRGTQKELAAVMGITPGAITQWRAVPAEHVLKVEEFTGISRHQLRPDVFGKDAA